MKTRLIATALVGLFLTFAANAQTAFDSALLNSSKAELKIIRITPSGEDVATSSRQMVFKFNQPMVAVGQMQARAADIPIIVEPPVQCEWRWIETTSLSCQLSRDTQLRKSTAYHVRVEPSLSALNGARLLNPYEHHFITQLPKVQRVYLEDWSDAVKPVARIAFDQPVTKSSLIRSLRLEAKNYSSSILVPDQWNSIVDASLLRFEGENEFKSFAPLAQGLPPLSMQTEVDLRVKAVEQARQVWRVQPAKELPENSEIVISLHQGLLGIEGDKTGIPVSNVHRFRSLPRFAFLGVHCTHKESYDELILKPTHITDALLRETVSGKELSDSCDPQQRIKLAFTGPVSYSTAESFLQITPDLAGGDPNYQPWSTRNDRYNLRSYLTRRFNYGNNQPYLLRVPEALKAFEQYSLNSVSGLHDQLGRELADPINMAFLTSHRKPRLVFEHSHSVLEKGLESELPAYVTNLDQLKINGYSVTTADSRESDLEFSKDLENAPDTAYKVPVGIRSLLDDRAGIVVGSLTSTPLQYSYGQDSYSMVSQVTPYQVHLKFGHFNSYVWVTDLSSGMPVEGAKVSIELDDYLSIRPQSANSKVSVTDKNGLAELAGIKDVDPELKYRNEYRFGATRLIVKVQKDENTAFLPVDGNYESWAQTWPNLRAKNGYIRAWGTTAQGVYKAGERVQYKLYVRGQSNRHWIMAPDGKYEIKVIDPKGQVVEKLTDITLNEFGSFQGEFTTPKNAAVGWYDFQLSFSNGPSSYTRYPMRVLVSDFVPASFRAGNDLNGDQFHVGDTVKVSSFAKMHAGGPYTDAQVRVTAMLTNRRFSSDHPLAQGFDFGHTGGRSQQTLHQSQSALDQDGELVSEFIIQDASIVYGRISVESAVRDDRGKFIAGRSSADYLGRDRFIGLKNSSWVHNAGKSTTVDSLVVDHRGNPTSGDQLSVIVERLVTKAARVKGAGNAYLTQYSSEWVKSSRCELKTNGKPLSCKFTPEHPGSHRITGSLTDGKGRSVSNLIHTWVVGKGAVVWNETNTNRIDIVANQKQYKSGETAKFLIKNPYPGAQALITKERYGVLKTWQKKLNGSTPVIEVPIESDDNPGFYLSVVVTSPRVAQPLGEGEVDLGKPVFKMGYLTVDVRDDSKEIDIKVKTDKKIYKPREKVTVSVKAKPNKGKREAMELAIVVLDEAVFDLNSKGEAYYDPYEGFNQLEGLGVANYNLLMRLVGRQRFEKKGANPGGGGGSTSDSGDLRDLLKFVAYWNPSIELDKNGKAKFDFSLPDNLTGWRVLAMVVDKEARMGLASSNFKVNRPTELRPVMPNQLTKGDSVQAGFSVMNRTDKSRTLEVQMRASGSALNQPLSKKLVINLAPYQRERVWMPVTTDSQGELAFFASAGDSKDRDAIEHHVSVYPRYTVLTEATYGTSIQDKVEEPIQFPGGIVSGVGNVSVEVSPSVIGNIAGAFRYMRDYPYACWEQRLSKGLAAAQYQGLTEYLPGDLDWKGSETLAQTTLDEASSFQASNGGMAYWVNNDDYVSPYLSAYTALAFVWLRKQGKQIPQEVENKLHKYLLKYLRNGNSEQQLNENLSVRSVAMAALAASKKITRVDLMRYRPYLPKMNLFAKAHYLKAANALGLEEGILTDVTSRILSQSVQSGGKFLFNEEALVGSRNVLHSSLRSNCAVLSSLLETSQSSDQVFSLLADIPFKQVRSITQSRGNRDHWENTQENIFCMNALLDFSKLYESEKPNLTVRGEFKSLNKLPLDLGLAEFDSLRDPSIVLESNDLKIKSNLKGSVNLSKNGQGRFYYGVRASFAKSDDSAKPINAGIEVVREYSVQRSGKWQLLSTPMSLNKGELVRVDIFLSTAAARNYVVVDDPVPGGLEPVNKDLATSSLVDASQVSPRLDPASWWYKRGAWADYGRFGYSFYHQELRHEAARFYSDYLPAGDYHLSYVAQVIANGSFAVKPLKVEEMYDPDVFGLGVPSRLEVDAANVSPQFNE